jgi:hypothetical protein
MTKKEKAALTVKRKNLPKNAQERKSKWQRRQEQEEQAKTQASESASSHVRVEPQPSKKKTKKRSRMGADKKQEVCVPPVKQLCKNYRTHSGVLGNFLAVFGLSSR